MPVTARLLQKLNETLGDDATNDLLAWWEDSVVTRGELRGAIEFQAQRFGADLNQGLSAVRAELSNGLVAVRAEMATMRSEIRAEMAAMKADLRTDIANHRAETAYQRADLMKWMFIFWAGTVIPLAGLMVALTRL